MLNSAVSESRFGTSLADSYVWRSEFATAKLDLHTYESRFELWFVEFLHVEFDKSVPFLRGFFESGRDRAHKASSGAVKTDTAGVGLGGVTGAFFGRGRSGITL